MERALTFPAAEKTGAMWTGQFILVDRYGNLITNFRSEEVKGLAEKAKVWLELPGRPETIRGVSKSYTDVAVGKLLMVAGPSGFLEVSIRDGNAANTLGLKPGDSLKLHFRI